jgi:hypothetical protein
MADRKFGCTKTDGHQTDNHARCNLQFPLHGNPEIPNHKTGFVRQIAPVSWPLATLTGLSRLRVTLV